MTWYVSVVNLTAFRIYAFLAKGREEKGGSFIYNCVKWAHDFATGPLTSNTHNWKCSTRRDTEPLPAYSVWIQTFPSWSDFVWYHPREWHGATWSERWLKSARLRGPDNKVHHCRVTASIPHCLLLLLLLPPSRATPRGRWEWLKTAVL